MFYNATAQETTGYSPFFIEHGREPRLPWHPHVDDEGATESVSDFVNRHLLGLHLAWEANMASLSERERERKEEHDRKYQTNVVFEAGDRVLLLQPGRRSKMELPYVGPFRILWGPDERDRYALRDMEGRAFNEFHVSKLKLWPADADEETLEDEHYVVETFVNHRVHEGVEQWLVKWKGWSQKHNSWEPLEHLNMAAREEAKQYANEQNDKENTTTNGRAAGAPAASKATKAKAGKAKAKPAKADDDSINDDKEAKQRAEREARLKARAERMQ